MATRNSCVLFFLLALGLVAGAGCGRRGALPPAGTMSRADSILLRVLPLDTLLARVEAKKSALHPDSLKAGHWMVRLDDPAELEAVRVHFYKKNRSQHYPGSWPLQLAAYKHDLRSDNPYARREALNALVKPHPIMEGQWDAELRGLIYRQMYDSLNGLLTVKITPEIDPSHAADSIIHLLQTGHVSSMTYNQALRSLEHTVPTMKTIDFLGKQIRAVWRDHDPDEEYQANAAIRGLLGLHDKADSLQRRKIERFVVNYRLLKPVESSENLQLVHCLAADPLPEYLQFFNTDLSDWRSSPASLTGYASIKGENARPLLTTYCGDSTLTMPPTEAIVAAWAGDPEAAIPVLVKALSMHRHHGKDMVIEAAMQIGGPGFPKTVIAAVPDAEERRKLQTYFHLLYEPIQADHPLRQEAQRLTQMGLIDGEVGTELLDSIQAVFREDGETNFEGVLLEHLACITRIDTREDLFLDFFLDDLVTFGFKKGARGRFDGLEYYFHRRPNSTGIRRQELWFIFGDHAYYTDFIMELGEVPADRLCYVLNEILSDAGIPERFHPIRNYSLWEQPYLFAKSDIAPQAIESLRFFLPGQRRYDRPDHVHLTM